MVSRFKPVQVTVGLPKKVSFVPVCGVSVMRSGEAMEVALRSVMLDIKVSLLFNRKLHRFHLWILADWEGIGSEGWGDKKEKTLVLEGSFSLNPGLFSELFLLLLSCKTKFSM